MMLPPETSRIFSPKRWLSPSLVLLLSILLLSCGPKEEIVYKGLYLWITSEAPATGEPIDRIVIEVRDLDGDDNPVLFDGSSVFEHHKEILLSSEYNIYESPYKAKLAAGETIRGSVYLVIHGLHNDQILSTWVGTANLNGNHKKEVLLALIAPGCDEDGDGLMPCATKPECCGGFSDKKLIDKLSDCADDDSNANPLMAGPERIA